LRLSFLPEIHPAVNLQLINSASWVNWVTGRDAGIKRALPFKPKEKSGGGKAA
jgi:hypothetical protein